jgi:hypothetical protein
MNYKLDELVDAANLFKSQKMMKEALGAINVGLIPFQEIKN